MLQAGSLKGDRRGDADRAGQVVLRCSNSPVGGVHVGQYRLDLIEIGLTGLGQFDPAGCAIEQASAQFCLQGGNLSAGSRFHQPSPVAARVNPPVFRYQYEGFQCHNAVHGAPIAHLRELLLQKLQQ